MPSLHIRRPGRRRRPALPAIPAVLATLVAAFAFAFALAVPGTAAAAAFSAQLQAPNHTPVANHAWPITVTISRGGAGLTGSLRYEFLLHGALVGTEAWHAFTGGVYHAALRFPSLAVGHALTFQIEVVTAYGTKYVDWAVTPHA